MAGTGDIKTGTAAFDTVGPSNPEQNLSTLPAATETSRSSIGSKLTTSDHSSTESVGVAFSTKDVDCESRASGQLNAGESKPRESSGPSDGRSEGQGDNGNNQNNDEECKLETEEQEEYEDEEDEPHTALPIGFLNAFMKLIGNQSPSPPEAQRIINPPNGCTQKQPVSCDYQPLPTPTSIRLVKLELAKEDQEDHAVGEPKEICCSVLVVDLADNPDYFALSYTWGDPRCIYTDKKDILPPEAWAAPAFEVDCDGKHVTVGTNLHTALLSLRSSFSMKTLADELGPQYLAQESSGVYLWIDALCINQTDLDEKNSQIPLMDRIYSQARATIMWLGGDEPLVTLGVLSTSTKLQRLMDRLQEMVECDNLEQEEERRVFLEQCRTFDLSSQNSFHTLDLEPISAKELVGWFLLVSRSWFKRAWVVQEWALSPSCVFLCGALIMQQDVLTEQASHLNITGWMTHITKIIRENTVDSQREPVSSRDHNRGRSESGWNYVPELFRASWNKEDPDHDSAALSATMRGLRLMMGYDRASQLPPSVRQELSGVIKAGMRLNIEGFRSKDSFDPRDKVFAFYSLFKDDQGRHIYTAPDYRKTVAQVYTEATQTMGESMGMRFLVFKRATDVNKHALPSWVVDFSLRPGQQFTHISPIYIAAAGLVPSTTEYLCNGSVLKATGCLIDTVAHSQGNPIGYGILAEGFDRLLQVLSHIPERSIIASPPPVSLHTDVINETYVATELSDQSRFEVLWRTLLKDDYQNGQEQPAPKRAGETYMRLLREYLILQITHVQLRDIKRTVEQVLEEAIGHEDDTFFAYLFKMLLGSKPEEELLRYIEDCLKDEEPHFHNTDYVRETEVNAILELNTKLAMLSGTLPFDSADLLTPHLWQECQKALEDTVEALRVRDIGKFEKSLDKAFSFQKASDLNIHSDSRSFGFRNKLTVFATSKGRLGLDPGGLEARDEVWLIAGLHAPIILRKEGEGRHRVIGCAYIHGIMHGEVVPTTKETTDVYLV